MSVIYTPPFTPCLYSKTGVYRAMQFFLIFALKHDCGYSLEPPHVLSKNKKNITIFHLQIIIFTVVKYCSILHGRVCVMSFMLMKFLNKMFYTHYNNDDNDSIYYIRYIKRF